MTPALCTAALPNSSVIPAASPATAGKLLSCTKRKASEYCLAQSCTLTAGTTPCLEHQPVIQKMCEEVGYLEVTQPTVNLVCSDLSPAKYCSKPFCVIKAGTTKSAKVEQGLNVTTNDCAKLNDTANGIFYEQQATPVVMESECKTGTTTF